ncbi:MAG TPA: signal recognition particle-docking protein FtsY [Rhodanobacteraceae bacterium]|nr:signal recognition particle-docking protein FtsY [Rhodanobacteraceae bacterium]
MNPMPNFWTKLARHQPRPDLPFAMPVEPAGPADAGQPDPSAGMPPRLHAGPSALPEIPLPNMANSPDDLMATATRPRRSWRDRLSGSGFARGLSSLFSRNPVLSDELLDEMEIVLLSADVGVTSSAELIDELRRRMHKREFADAAALRDALRERLVALLGPVARPLDVGGRKPFMLLVVGVNGVGKTTTIGKLARRFQEERRDVLLAAGDTFRAAAVAQLQEWANRLDIPVCAQGQGADSASVIFDAMQMAIAHGNDVLIADTAGRLHTRSGLMDELAKVKRVVGKLDAEAPHEVLMVIDGTTGQNAINQVRQFIDAVGVTGLVVTKLDGTAKGGVVFALAHEFALPIRYVGLGERAEDLRVFDPRAFVDGLLPGAG